MNKEDLAKAIAETHLPAVAAYGWVHENTRRDEELETLRRERQDQGLVAVSLLALNVVRVADCVTRGDFYSAKAIHKHALRAASDLLHPEVG